MEPDTKGFAPWVIAVLTAIGGAAAAVFAALQNYRKNQAETAAANAQTEINKARELATIEIEKAKQITAERKGNEEIQDAASRRKETEVNAAVIRLYQLLDRVEKEHKEDRANLVKLHEDYMVTREELSRCRERCAYLEQRVKQLEQVRGA